MEPVEHLSRQRLAERVRQRKQNGADLELLTRPGPEADQEARGCGWDAGALDAAWTANGYRLAVARAWWHRRLQQDVRHVRPDLPPRDVDRRRLERRFGGAGDDLHAQRQRLAGGPLDADVVRAGRSVRVDVQQPQDGILVAVVEVEHLDRGVDRHDVGPLEVGAREHEEVNAALHGLRGGVEVDDGRRSHHPELAARLASRRLDREVIEAVDALFLRVDPHGEEGAVGVDADQLGPREGAEPHEDWRLSGRRLV